MKEFDKKEFDKYEAHQFLGQTPDILRELWIEIPGDCHLNCSYCLAFENKGDFCFRNRNRFDARTGLLSVEEYLNILKEFQTLYPLTDVEKKDGVKKMIGIPAAGEPFFTKRMRDYVYPIMSFCEENDITISIFTTGDLITEDDISRLQPMKNIRLIIKLNSFFPEVQDRIVGRRGYALARNSALARLIAAGFNDGRLGIVTSLMDQNSQEAESLLRFARENNLTFDMDLIISRGRGGACDCHFKSKDDLLKTVEHLKEVDNREYGREWIASPTYIGSKPCSRFSYSMYIQNNGNVSPCIGANQVIYGNLREQSLESVWNSRISSVVRNRRENIRGACAGCKNFGKTCFSCLSRCAVNLPETLEQGYLETVGCNIFGPVK
jgi:MoaA/NifB/PqqE/SkfB family radical SAM enzyme